MMFTFSNEITRQDVRCQMDRKNIFWEGQTEYFACFNGDRARVWPWKYSNTANGLFTEWQKIKSSRRGFYSQLNSTKVHLSLIILFHSLNLLFELPLGSTVYLRNNKFGRVARKEEVRSRVSRQLLDKTNDATIIIDTFSVQLTGVVRNLYFFTLSPHFSGCIAHHAFIVFTEWYRKRNHSTMFFTSHIYPPAFSTTRNLIHFYLSSSSLSSIWQAFHSHPTASISCLCSAFLFSACRAPIYCWHKHPHLQPGTGNFILTHTKRQYVLSPTLNSILFEPSANSGSGHSAQYLFKSTCVMHVRGILRKLWTDLFGD